MAYRRQTLAQLTLQVLEANVAERREAFVVAKASGAGEQEAKAALREAEERMSDPEVQLEPEVRAAEYELQRKAWAEHLARYRATMVEEHAAHGEQILAVVRDCRARLADAQARWKSLDTALFFAVRTEYRTGSGGSGDIGAFPGLEGPLRPALPRDLAPAPTMMATTPGASVGVPVEVVS